VETVASTKPGQRLAATRGMSPLQNTTHAKEVLLRRRDVISKSRTRNDADAVGLSSERREEDQAENEEISDVLLLLSDRETVELREIEAALERLARGAWGRCDSCGEPIEPRRLNAIPEARRCADCAASS